MPLLVLLLLADVEDHGGRLRVAVLARRVERFLDRGRIELLDPGARLLDQLLARDGFLLRSHDRPRFPLNSI
jgi:hypothetical protein